MADAESRGWKISGIAVQIQFTPFESRHSPQEMQQELAESTHQHSFRLLVGSPAGA
jgi:hypothetical protein